MAFFFMFFFPFFSAYSLDSKDNTFHTSHDAKLSVLIAHGLNNKESVMNDIKTLLPKKSYNFLSIQFTGHHDDLKSFEQIKAEKWIEDLYAGWLRLKELKKPILFIGYSLGALVALDALIKKKEIIFKRMILFAPAIKTRWYISFIKLLFFLSEDTLIASSAPEYYKANSGTSIAAYKALFNLIDSVESSNKARLNIPSTIFIDSEDELISYSGLTDFIASNNLQKNWNITKVESQNKFKHLIIDKESLGEKQWGKIRKIIIKALESD